MKAREWQEKSAGEREKAILELKDKARKLRFDLATREAKNHSDYDKIKKDIARLLTLKQAALVSIDVAQA
ncbi:MAG: 50S ribosomal protein L29 [Candidatus Moranbacteria bacterium RIFCSPHIGHO2_12_FULL_54_9]|nr:MAG: 50S ribosomal protein L29 [Candidatus Moranbacteria bacterium RIFCSPHIGHO2_01_FULL_54_31]OGI26132.1 MAG: 50S ribosomal protein L29 [Candidatus Moranbacteria bacterium RIFCSPHIGHO2_12_FULL_54_9]